jgi:uncharacterized protein YcbK (DUF882 family)
MLHFKLEEFDSPDLPGTGYVMDKTFLNLLDRARDAAGIPFVITSGFRTLEHQNELKKQGYPVSKSSSHLKGLAADILCTDSASRLIIIESLLYVGFRRIGISGKGKFIHVDLDKDKKQDVIWVY